jgi:hypothetical protein
VYGPKGQASRFSFNGNGQFIEVDNPASHHGCYTYPSGDVVLFAATAAMGEPDAAEYLSLARPLYTTWKGLKQ